MLVKIADNCYNTASTANWSCQCSGQGSTVASVSCPLMQMTLFTTKKSYQFSDKMSILFFALPILDDPTHFLLTSK